MTDDALDDENNDEEKLTREELQERNRARGRSTIEMNIEINEATLEADEITIADGGTTEDTVGYLLAQFDDLLTEHYGKMKGLLILLIIFVFLLAVVGYLWPGGSLLQIVGIPLL